MTKKLLAAAVFLLAAGTGAVFAQEAATREEASEQPKSRGVQGGRLGAYFGYNFAGYTDEPLKTANAKLGGVDFGILVDMKYADLLLGLNRDYKEADYLSDDIEIIHGVIGLMGKYPIPIGPRLRIAPEAGFEYQFILLYNGWSRDNVEKLAALLGAQANPESSTWAFLNLDNFVFKFGACADYLITEKIFVRLDILGSYQFAHNDDVSADAAFGADFRLAAGWKF